MISIQFVYTATAPPYIKYKTVNPQLRSFYPFDDYLSVSKCAIHISSLFKLKAIETWIAALLIYSKWDVCID